MPSPRPHGESASTAAPSYEDAKPHEHSNYWSSSENNRNNAWNVNFNSGNVNNNNKNNQNVTRAVAALGECPEHFTQSVWQAYFDCLRGKTSSPDALAYMAIAADDIPVLVSELWNGTYQPSTSTCFLVRYPKLREVFAANFRDRIVHHWVCLRLNPLFEHRFILQGNVSFNCRKGFGPDKAVNHVAEEMCRISHHYHKEAWVFRGDLVGFFMSIDKELLWYLLRRFILRWHRRWLREEWASLTSVVNLYDLGYTNGKMPEMYWSILLTTVETIVKHHPERDCVLNTDPALWQGLAPNKSLFTSETGEPIGNLTTQLFANFLMTYFVSYVKWLFRRHNFGIAQFVDDFVIVCDDERFLIDSLPKISSFLSDKLHLTMHKDKRYLQPVSHGLLFVGTYSKPLRLYLSNRTLARFKERCNGFRRLMEQRELTPLDCQRIEQVINSYLGFCKDRRTYRRRVEYVNSMGSEFWRYFIVRGHYNSIRARPQYRPLSLIFN